MIRLYKHILLSAIALAAMPAQGSMVACSIAKHAVATTRLIPASAAPKMLTRVLTTTQKTHQQIQPALTRNHDKKCKHDSYTKQHSYKWAAIGAAVMLGHTSYQVAQCQEEEKYTYPFEFESARKAFYEYLKARPWGNVSKKYMEEYENKYQAIMQKWYELTGLTPAQWQKYMRDNMDVYNSTELEEINDITVNLPLEKLLITKAHTIMQELGLDKDRIELTHGLYPFIPVAAFSHHILINPEGVKIFCENTEQFQAAFLHELQHILHNDVIVSSLMEKFYEDKKNISYTAFVDLMKQFSHLREMRADILAALVDPKYAKASIDAFLKFKNPSPGIAMLGALSTDFYEEADSHPSFAHRVANLNQLHEEMLAEIEKNRAQINI